MRLLLIDNYDSFTWNLVQYFEELGATVEVALNDAIDVAGVRKRDPQALVISPGPGRPEDAGISLASIEALAGELPLLGVCLGHQAIAQAHGARIVRAPTLMHGKTSRIEHDATGLFAGIEASFEATRYHSLVIDRDTLSDDFKITARTQEDVVMAIEHRRQPLYGVQFHPESILTVEGKALLANFLQIATDWHVRRARSA